MDNFFILLIFEKYLLSSGNKIPGRDPVIPLISQTLLHIEIHLKIQTFYSSAGGSFYN